MTALMVRIIYQFEKKKCLAIDLFPFKVRTRDSDAAKSFAIRIWNVHIFAMMLRKVSYAHVQHIYS